ncbi:MAG: PBP1A family penicillin-binding protein [Thermodesulfovibrionales bacterium]|nr:PBP1A family penicillin-binding protein [Thermodesulfovibrionales bacterium]
MKIKWILILFALFVISTAGSYLAIAKGTPSIAELKKYRFAEGTKVYADDETLLGEFKEEKGVYVTLSKIPEHLKNAVIATEDSRFYKHKGIDYIGIGRALIKDIMHGSLKEGGSTITQQLAKILFLTPEKTLKRKIREAQLAVKLESELSKDEILELYLNRIYLGHGAYGVEMAAQKYFGKHVSQLTLPECALIAGLIKAPNTYSPFNDLVKAKDRQEVVLMRMEEEGYIKPSEREWAKKQPLHLTASRGATDAHNYFLEYVRNQLEQRFGADTVYRGNLRVYTTIDKKAQILAQRALQEGLREIDKRRGWRGAIGKKDISKEKTTENNRTVINANINDITTGIVLEVTPKEAVIKARGIVGKMYLQDAMWASNILDSKTGRVRQLKNPKLTDIISKGDVIYVRFKSITPKEVVFSLEQEPEVEGAIVAIEPDTGYIKAMVGGFSFIKSEFNRATLAKRQPGSAFKPLIYASALENGFTPASIIVDEPISFSSGVSGSWQPENYDHKYYGPTRLREALAYSRNVVTVKLLQSVGIDKFINFAKDIGIEAELPRDLTISLGSISISPLDLALSYLPFANGGIRYKEISIKLILDSKGNVLEENLPEGTVVMSPQSAFLITSMLEDVIKYGTGRRANIGIPAAGKTGTSNDYKDAWFVGYTPEILTCVWVGFDDMKKSLGPGEVGGKASAPIWASFMRSWISKEGEHGFMIPDGIVRLPIDPNTGLLSYDSTVYEYFKEGNHPLEYAKTPSRLERQQPQNLDYD